jgi:hypothetical protein
MTSPLQTGVATNVADVALAPRLGRIDFDEWLRRSRAAA